MIAGNGALALLLAGALVVPLGSSADAKPGLFSGVDIPFPVIDAATGCATTGRVKMEPDVSPGLITTEKITAIVDSPVCRVTWTVSVGIIDNAQGYPVHRTGASGTGSATAEQDVTYAMAGAPLPQPVRGPSNIYMWVRWVGSNGVRGCMSTYWVAASYADAYEVGPLVPCDHPISLMD